jgi:primosomal protein N' (replication factor Y)
VRWDPAWLAERELADRRELGFPPVTRIASLTGSPAALADFLAAARLPDGADLLGPVPEPPRPGQEGERERFLVRVPRSQGAALASALAEVQGVRSARKVPEHVRVQLDPLDLV